MEANQPQSVADIARLIRDSGVFSPGVVLEGEDWIDLTEQVLVEWAVPDFVTLMDSKSAVQEYQGRDGLREALTDWVTPYESFRVAVDEVLSAGDDKLVFLVRQLARTKHQGVDMETASAAVWSIEGGRVTQTVFYLDQGAALKAAGLDPDRPSGK